MCKGANSGGAGKMFQRKIKFLDLFLKKGLVDGSFLLYVPVNSRFVPSGEKQRIFMV
jgi:hypothetical protein